MASPQMVADVEVYRSAQHADAMLEKGSLDGQRVGKRVVKAIKETQRQERGSRELLQLSR